MAPQSHSSAQFIKRHGSGAVRLRTILLATGLVLLTMAGTNLARTSLYAMSPPVQGPSGRREVLAVERQPEELIRACNPDPAVVRAAAEAAAEREAQQEQQQQQGPDDFFVKSWELSKQWKRKVSALGRPPPHAAPPHLEQQAARLAGGLGPRPRWPACCSLNNLPLSWAAPCCALQIIAAVPLSKSGIPWVRASRTWRKGIRAVFVADFIPSGDVVQVGHTQTHS